VPYYESAEILPFEDKEIGKDDQATTQFQFAQSALFQIKSFKKNLGEVLDYDKMAIYMAINDLGGSYHGMAWHNIRFYFNPMTYKLEPIAFDCFAESRDFKKDRAIYGFNTKSNVVQRDVYFNKQLLNDTVFKQIYQTYLETLTPDFVRSFMTEIEGELKANLDLIQEEYEWYDFDDLRFLHLAERIQKDLPDFREKSFKDTAMTYEPVQYSGTNGSDKFVKEASLKVYTSQINEREKTVTCYNFHVDDIKIIGYSFKKKKEELIAMTPQVLKAYKGVPNQFDLTVPLNVKRIHFVHNGDTNRVKILDWARYQKYPFAFTTDLSELHDISGVKIEGKTIVMDGIVDINEACVVPAEYKLVIKPGSMITFDNHGSLVCHGDVLMGGLEMADIVITGPEGAYTSGGISILGKGNKVEMYNTHFVGMSAYDAHKNPRTGMLSIYESKVNMKGCVFGDNQSEDALNIIRSEVSIDYCRFYNIQSDALDLDFCKGTVSNCQFKDVKNDAMDISGSHIHFDNIVADKIGDKGVSVGERSIATARNMTISNANIAFVSKDDSDFEVFKSQLSNNQLNFAVFMKKTEYGPARMTVWTSKIDSEEILIDKGSVVDKGGTVLIGDKRVNVDSLYAPFKTKLP
jgi:hypothetical protein